MADLQIRQFGIQRNCKNSPGLSLCIWEIALPISKLFCRIEQMDRRRVMDPSLDRSTVEVIL